MSDLSKFDISKKTKSTRDDIFFSLKDMLSLGIGEFTKSLRWVTAVPREGKNQITRSLVRREEKIKRMRQVGK